MDSIIILDRSLSLERPAKLSTKIMVVISTSLYNEKTLQTPNGLEVLRKKHQGAVLLLRQYYATQTFLNETFRNHKTGVHCYLAEPEIKG